MKTSTVALLIAWMSCTPAMANGPDLSEWTHVADVELAAPPADKGLVELSLSPDAFDVSRTDLADLRLATDTGQTLPYVLRVSRGEPGQSVSYRPARMFNPTFIPGKQSTVTVDFGSRAKRTSVFIDTPGSNFRRRAMIEARQDGESWQVLRKTAWLFQITFEHGSHRKNQVVLSDNDFRYLRVTVFNSPDDPEQVIIRNVSARYVTSTPPGTLPVAINSATVTENPKLKVTDIQVDLGYANLPLYDVAMSFETANFLRRVEILGRNVKWRTVSQPVESYAPRMRKLEQPWARLTGGTVHRFGSGNDQDFGSPLRLPASARYRYLLIRIHNGDDAPLKFTGVKVRRLQHYLAFQPQPAGPYRLYMGNPQAQRPKYDLVHFVENLRAKGVTHAALGQVGPNPLCEAEIEVVPWSERNKWLLWTALVAVLAALGILALRQARRAQQSH